MAGYTSKFNASSNKNTSFLPGMSMVDINALYVSAAGAINEVKENLEEFGDQVVETATEVKDNVVEFGNDVADTFNAGVDKVQTFFTSTVDGKDTKLFNIHPKKKGEFYLEDYTNLDFSKYESMYDSEEIVDYLQELTVNTSYEIYKNQQTIDFYQQFLDAYHSEAWLNTNYVRIDDFPDLYEKWLTEMDEKMHADWYADPEKYATQIAYLESTRKARMDSSCGGVPPSLVDEVIMLSAEREYRNIIDANCSDEKMHRDPDFENIYNSYKESYEGFKGASDYTMEKYGVSGDEYYYYFIDAQVNGESIIGSLTNANYNMKQGLDLEPFEQIKLSEGFVNANIDTKFDYAGNYSFFLDDYGKSYFWNEDYLKETYGVESKEDWELMKKTQFMEESDRELYFYLLGKDESLAQEFLDAHEDQINQSIACVKTLDELEESGIISYNKELAEQRLEAALAQDPNLDVKAFRNQCRIDTTCYEINTGGAMDVINDYADSLGFGVRDGVIQWGEGIGNAICADGIKSVKDYQRMYMVQILSQGENSRELLNETYQFGVAAGNMLPTVAVGTAVTVASGGNVAAGEAVSKALLVTSAYGNTKEQVMQTYEISRGQAYLYAGASAGLELVMEGKLGSVLPLADKEAASFIEAFVKEGTQEAAQSVIESAMNLTLGEEFDVGNVLTEAVGEGIYGGLVGGTFYGVNHVTSPLVSAGIISNVAKRNNISYVEAKGMYMQYGAEYADSDSKVSFNNYVKTNLAAKPSVNNTVSNIDATTIDVSYPEQAEAANTTISNDIKTNVEVNASTNDVAVADISVENFSSPFTDAINSIGESISSKVHAVKGIVTKINNIDFSNLSILDKLRNGSSSKQYSEIMQQIDDIKQQAENEGRFSLFHSQMLTKNLPGVNNIKGLNYLYDLMTEYDNKCMIPYEVGTAIENLMANGNRVLVHRTYLSLDTDDVSYDGNDILYDMMNNGLKNFGHSGVDYSNDAPDIALTMTALEGFTGYANLLSRYKGSNVIVLASIPNSMVDSTAHMTVSPEQIYNIGENGEHVIKPEFMYGVIVKTEDGLWNFYSRDDVIKQFAPVETKEVNIESKVDDAIIKPSEENMSIFKESVDINEFSSMKRIYDILTKMINSNDPLLKLIGQNIQNIKQGNLSSLYFTSSRNYLKSAFGHYDDVSYGSGSAFVLNPGVSNEVSAHELGHMLFGVMEKNVPDNYNSVIANTRNNILKSKSVIEEFLENSKNYKEQFNARLDVEINKYFESEVGKEYIQSLVDETKNNRARIIELMDEVRLAEAGREKLLSEFDENIMDKVEHNLTTLFKIRETFKFKYESSLYDHQMQQIDMITGVIDSVFGGNNPYYDMFLESGFNGFRYHSKEYFAKNSTIDFDEQFADYTAMRIYDDNYQVAKTFLKNVMGTEWFDMMDAKFATIAEKFSTLGSTVEEETSDVDLGIDIGKDSEGYITGITIDIDTLKSLQTLVGRDSYSYNVIGDYINENATEMTYRDFDNLLYSICTSMDLSLSYVKEANPDGYFNSSYEKYQNALNKCIELRGYTSEDVGTKDIEKTFDKSRTEFVNGLYKDTESVKKFINACLELQNARTDYYRSNDLILAKNEISDSFKYFKSDEEVESFNSEYEELLKNGTVEDVRNYLNAAQQEILDHWANTVTPIDEYKEGDPFKFICHSVFGSNFKGDFYTRFVSTSLLTDNLTDTYKSGFGFIFNPENIVGASSQDMYIDNAARSTDDLQISTSMPQIDSPEKMISECMELKNQLANEGKEEKVYNEVVIDGFNPAAIFCIIDGTERGYSNYENALKLQEQFPELRVIRLPKNDTIDVTADYRQVATQNAMDEYYEPTAPIEVLTEEDLEDTLPIEVQVAPLYDYASAESANQTIDASVTSNIEMDGQTQGKTSIFDRLRNMTKRDPSVVTEKIEKAYDELDKTSPMELAGVVNMIIDENAYNEFLNNRANMELFDKHKSYDAIMSLVGVINSKGTSLKFSLAEKARLNTLYNLALTDNIENHVDEIVSGTIVPDKRTFYYMINNELLNTTNPEHINLINEYIRKYADNVINVTDIDAIDNKVLGSNDRFNTVYEYDGKRLTTNEIKDMLDVTTPELKTKILLKAYEYEDSVARARKAYIELNKVLHYDNDYLTGNVSDESIMNQNKYLSFGTLNKRNSVVCLGWANLYSDLLYDLGFTKDQVLVKTNKGNNHYWVELHVDDNTVIIADATEGHEISKGKYNVDLSSCKSDDSTTGFVIGDKSMTGLRLSVVYKNLTGEQHDYTPGQVNDLKKQIDNSNNRLLQVDKEIKYVNDNGLYNENLAIASSRFDQLDDVSDHNESDKAMYLINMPIPEGMDGYDLFGYYKRVTALIDSKYVRVSRDSFVNENGEWETMAELICEDDRGNITIKAYSESNGVMMFNGFNELNDFVNERNGK